MDRSDLELEIALFIIEAGGVVRDARGLDASERVCAAVCARTGASGRDVREAWAALATSRAVYRVRGGWARDDWGSALEDATHP